MNDPDFCGILEYFVNNIVGFEIKRPELDHSWYSTIVQRHIKLSSVLYQYLAAEPGTGTMGASGQLNSEELTRIGALCVCKAILSELSCDTMSTAQYYIIEQSTQLCDKWIEYIITCPKQ